MVAQIGWRGPPAEQWLPIDGLVLQLPPLRTQRAAALSASCRLAATLLEPGSPTRLPRCPDWSFIRSVAFPPPPALEEVQSQNVGAPDTLPVACPDLPLLQAHLNP